MKAGNKKILRGLQVISIILLLAIIVFISYRIKSDPKIATADGITALISSDLGIAVLEFWALYMIKGLSFVFPSAALNISAGAVFGFPLSFFVSVTGIFLEFILIFYMGRFMGSDITEWLSEKYPKVNKLGEIGVSNGFYLSFLIRILGFISYDVGSLYLGATGVKTKDFILGSMLGAIINVLLANLFGLYIFNLGAWQVWVILAIRIIIIGVSLLIKKKKYKIINGKQD